jgi:subtilisin family serine protease
MGCTRGRHEEAQLRHRDLPLTLGALLVAVFVALATLAVRAPRVPDAPARSASHPVEVAATIDAATDLLLVSPAPASDGRTRPADLAAALDRLGYVTLPASAPLDAVRVRVPAGADAAALARDLAATGLLAAVESDVRVHADRLPGDPLVLNQQPYLDAIRAPLAWDRRTSADQVTIAVVDSGVDIGHPDLASRIRRNPAELPDGRDEDANGCPDDFFGCTFVSPAAADPSCGYTQAAPRGGAVDDDGHGTFVAGIAAAAGGNALGATGIAWDARILPVKVLDCTATGRISDAAAGILYAARSGARVIILAFGSPSDARVLRDAVAEATDRYGALVVASVGNEGAQRVQFPAAYPRVLAVAGSGVVGAEGIVDYRRPAVFSNAGPEVGVYAPAVRLIGPLPAARCGQAGWSCVEPGYARASGTSFAAPLAAGAVALMMAADPSLSPALAAALLIQAAQPFEGSATGRLLDVAAALDRQAYTAGTAGTAYGRPGPPAQGPGADPLR